MPVHNNNLFKNLSNIVTGKRDVITKKFTVSSLCNTKAIGEQDSGVGAWDLVKKFSDVEIKGKAFEKLRSVVSISESGKAGTILGDGVNWVFDKLNFPLPDSLGDVAKNFNPNVVNGAIGAAKGIAEKVKQRDFKLKDIPTYVSDIGNFEAMISGIFVPDKKIETANADVCSAIDYAVDFATDYSIKYKFMFVVEFVPNYDFRDLVLKGINPAAFVKQFEIPAMTIEHEEVNMYNYRTKVPKFTSFPNSNMTFYDDGRNHVMTLIENYMKTMSPVFRVDEPFATEFNSIDYANTKLTSSLRTLDDSSAYEGIQASNFLIKNILKEIRVYHVFFASHYFNMYSFLNPRFNTIKIQPFDFEENAVSMIDVDFNYDSMYMEMNRPFVSDKNAGNLMASSILNSGIVYKGKGTSTKPNANEIASNKDPADAGISKTPAIANATENNIKSGVEKQVALKAGATPEAIDAIATDSQDITTTVGGAEQAGAVAQPGTADQGEVGAPLTELGTKIQKNRALSEQETDPAIRAQDKIYLDAMSDFDKSQQLEIQMKENKKIALNESLSTKERQKAFDQISNARKLRKKLINSSAKTVRGLKAKGYKNPKVRNK